MSKSKVQYPGLRGSEQHHELKDQPGEEGDQDHDDGARGSLPDDIAEAIKVGDDKTGIAAALKDAVSDAKP